MEDVKTPIGSLTIIADERALYGIAFQGISSPFQGIRTKIALGRTAPIDALKEELLAYFNGNCPAFHTPIEPIGTPFQCRVWQALQKIPYGEVRSYLEIATAIGNPLAVRAVAQAIGSNRLAIISPCHRVIYADGKLGGYRGGVEKKRRLLGYEKVCDR